MKTFKFREYVYGDLIQRNGKTLIHERGSIAAKYVEPDSVRQLIAFDDKGNEIYQGDVTYPKFNPKDLTSYAATPYSVELEPIFIDNYGKHYYLPKGFIPA